MGLISGKCVFCERPAGSVTKYKDWVCGKCLREIGGATKWLKIRNLPSAELLALKKQAIKTKILDHGGGVVAIKKGGLGRAAVGGALFGDVGAIVGAGTGKRRIDRNDYTVFKVWFNDGSEEIQRVLHDSNLYAKYLSLLED